MSRIIRMLVAVLAAGGLALTGLLTAAGAASATTGPGTTGPGSWFFDQGDGNNAITTTSSPPTVSYKAAVQQPINAPGQIPSVFSNKTRTIPVKYVVQKCTTPGASTTHYPDTLTSLNGVSYPGIGSYGNLSVTVPTGTTVSQVTNLTANFQWLNGTTNEAGSMRWVINTRAGNVDVYYGEPFNTGGGTVDSGVNMITDPTNTSRVDVWVTNNNVYDTWNNSVMSNPAVANEPVNWVALVVDSGFAGTEQVQLSGVQVEANGVTDTYTPGDVSSGGGATTCATDTTDSMYIYLAKVSSNSPVAPIDESLITDTQGDTGGQFRVANGFYMYNLPLSQLTDLSAQYQVGISPNPDGSSPVGVVQFGLK
jgi:hypothetical protein